MAHTSPVELPVAGKSIKFYVDWSAPGNISPVNILTGTKVGSTQGEALATSMGKISEWYDWLIPVGGQEGQVLTWDTDYTVTSAQPSDWATNYKSYYTKSGDNYIPVTGDSAPTWAANTYYKFAAGIKPFKWATPTVDAANLTGTVPVSKGGTGATDAAGARTNLSVYSTTETDTAISTALSALGNILRFKGVKASVDQLPTTGNKIGDVWFVGTNTTAGKDDFTEYVWAQVSSSPDVYEWEYLGKVQVDPDLSDYLTDTALSGAYGTGSKTWVTTLTQSKNGGSATSVGTSTVPTASTSVYGITSLSTATDSSATDVAATPSAVKAAYDLAASKSTVTYSQTVASSATGAYEIGKITLGTTTTTIYGVNTNTTYTGNKGVKLSGTTFSADLKSDTALTDAINVALPTGGTANRLYGVQLDSDGHLAVNVPWTDTITAIPYSDANPIVAGTASPGTSTDVSRADHVHPAQTSVSGNAGTATKLATARAIDGVKFDGSANIKHFGECSTTAATAAKTVNVNATNSNFVLETGAAVIVKFTTTNTAAVANLTLSVNGSTAKSIKYRGANLPSADVLSSGRIYKFVYDGTYWQLVGDLDTHANIGVVTKTTNGLVGAPGDSPAGKYYKVDNNGVPSWTGDPIECDDSLVIHCTA